MTNANPVVTQLSQRFFYGWVIVVAVFFMTATAAGIIYAFPAFFDSFTKEFDTTRVETSFVFAICEFIWFMTGFVGGLLADRFGPRAVGFLGASFMAAGLALAASSTSIYTLYFAYGAGVGIGGGLIYVPAVSIVQRWFKKRRGMASGLAICGTGIGTLVFPFLATLLIENVGWRNTHFFFALCAILICGAASYILVADPTDIGSAPDGEQTAADASPVPVATGVSLAEAVGSRPFWHLYIASLLSSAGVFITYVHLVPYAIDNQNSKQASIALIGLMGISSTLGRFVLGGLADHVGRRNALSIMFIALSLTMTWWLLAPANIVVLMIYAVAFGAFYGGYITVLPALAMDFFGGRRISTIIGALYTSWAFGALFGPTLAGVIFDANRSYFYAILMGVLFMSLSATSCLTIREPKKQY